MDSSSVVPAFPKISWCGLNGHVFVYAGSFQRGLEGFPCSCGLMKAQYVSCPYCGNESLKAIPVGNQ